MFFLIFLSQLAFSDNRDVILDSKSIIVQCQGQIPSVFSFELHRVAQNFYGRLTAAESSRGVPSGEFAFTQVTENFAFTLFESPTLVFKLHERVGSIKDQVSGVLQHRKMLSGYPIPVLCQVPKI